MGDIQQLLERARRHPASLKFRELIQLAEALGFTKARHRGTSHLLYTTPNLRRPLNFQPRGDMAKPEQVRQLIRAYDELSRANTKAAESKEGE